MTTPGNKIVHCDGCYNLFASKTFKSVFAKASSDFYELDTKLNQANEKLIETNESVAEIEEKIFCIQVLLEKFINDINNNSINRSGPEQDGSNSESSVNEIPNAVTDNLQDRIKRKNRAVLFNVPCYEEDKENLMLGGYSDYDFIVELMQESGLKFKPKECFRVLSGCNADSPRPPLIIEFGSEYHKYKFLIQCRNLINEFKEADVQLTRSRPCGLGRMSLTKSHWINSLSVAPDRTYADRKLYKELKLEMIARNTELENKGETETFWIIKDLSLELIKKN